VYSTWLNGLYYGNDWFREIDKNTYFENYHKVLEAIFKRPETQIIIACLKEDEDVILAYAITEGQTLHWIFTKPVWRRMGLSRLILKESIKAVSHLTRLGKSIKPREWRFNPFLV
jgi:hypothetical protein